MSSILFPDDPCRITGKDAVTIERFGHNRTRTNNCIITNLRFPSEDDTIAYQDVISDDRYVVIIAGEPHIPID